MFYFSLALDGSPLPPGAKIESYPGQKSVQPAPASTVPPQPPVQQITSNPRAPYSFTTQPTVKPACASCGYVTTQKSVPAQAFQFQNPAFNNPQPVEQNPLVAPEQPQSQNFPPYQQVNDPDRIDVYNRNQGQEQSISPQGPNQNLNYPNQDINNIQNSNYPNQGPNDQQQYSYPESSPQEPQYPNPGVEYPGQTPLSQVSVSNGAIHVPGRDDIPIQDKYPGMVDGLPNGIDKKDITDLLYKFNYTVGFHGHYEKGLKDGSKVGGYFVNGRDGISRIVTYVADENGFRPKVKFIRLDLNSDEVPKEGSEKSFGLKNFEFIWYPVS